MSKVSKVSNKPAEVKFFDEEIRISIGDKKLSIQEFSELLEDKLEENIENKKNLINSNDIKNGE